MKTNKKSYRIILRWLFFLPLSFIIFYLSYLCFEWSLYFLNEKLLHDLNSNYDFGGHYILGPTAVFLREFISVGCAVYSGVSLAPNYKISVFYIFLIIWILLMIVASFSIGLKFQSTIWTLEIVFRYITEIFAQIFGFIISGILIWKDQENQKEINSFNKNI